MSTNCYVRTFGKLDRSNFVVEHYVFPVTILCEVLYLNGKTLVYDSPRTVAVLNEYGDSGVVTKLLVECCIPLALVKNEVRCLVTFLVIVVAVVSECTTCEIVLVAVNCEYKSCVTGVSVELSLKLIYIVGVCSNCILGLCNVTEVVTLCTAGLVVSNGVKSVTVDSYGVFLCKVLVAYLTVIESSEGELCKVNVFLSCIFHELVESLRVKIVDNSVLNVYCSLRSSVAISVVETNCNEGSCGKSKCGNGRSTCVPIVAALLLAIALICLSGVCNEFPFAVSVHELNGNGETFVYYSPVTVSLFVEKNGNVYSLIELSCGAVVLIALSHLNVRNSVTVSVKVVAVVCETTVNEVVVKAVDCERNASVAAVSVELSLELVYIERVLGDSVLSLSNISKLGGVAYGSGCKAIAVELNLEVVSKYLVALCALVKGLINEVSKINIFFLSELNESVDGRSVKIVEACVLDVDSSFTTGLTASVVSTECYVEALGKNYACGLFAAYVCPVTLCVNVLYVYSKSVVDNSPVSVAFFNENGNLCMIAELIVEVSTPLVLEDLRVGSSYVVDLVVAVVSECATYEVVLCTVSCEYYARITGASVELSSELVYVVGVCCNSVLGLTYVAKVVALVVVSGILSGCAKCVTVDDNVIYLFKLVCALCALEERLVSKTCEVNCVVLYEGEKVVDSNFLFFLFRNLGSFGLSDYAVSLSLENSVLLCIDGVEVNCEEYVVNCCSSCKVARYYGCSYVAFGLLVSLNVSVVSHLVKLGYSAVVVLARSIRIMLNCRIYRCTVNGYLVDIVTAVLACGYIKLEGVDSYGFLEAVSEYMVVLYGRTVSELELGTVVRIGVAHRA